MNDYEKAMKVQYGALDKIDFEPYFEKYNGKDVYTLMDAVSDDYDESNLTKDPVLSGYIFNYLSINEFIEYLEKRYKKKFKIKTHIYHTFSYGK
jgi:hypothetical protein